MLSASILAAAVAAIAGGRDATQLMATEGGLVAVVPGGKSFSVECPSWECAGGGDIKCSGTGVDVIGGECVSVAVKCDGPDVMINPDGACVTTNAGTMAANTLAALEEISTTLKGGGTPIKKDTAVWLDMAPGPGCNQNGPGSAARVECPLYDTAKVLKLVGFGFDTHYQPAFKDDFKCHFGPSVVTYGTVVHDDAGYTVECPTPGGETSETEFELTLEYLDARGPLNVSFTGPVGRDVLLVSNGVLEAKYEAGSVWARVYGFDPSAEVTCKMYGTNKSAPVESRTFAQPEYNSDGWMNCGPIASWTESVLNTYEAGFVSATLGVFDYTTGTKYAFKGAAGDDGVLVALDADGKKNGDETDVDCGGPFTQKKCGLSKSCKIDADCAAACPQGGAPTCHNDMCGSLIDGSEKSCKEILEKQEVTCGPKNGVFPIAVSGKRYTVACMNEGELGGGWTIAYNHKIYDNQEMKHSRSNKFTSPWGSPNQGGVDAEHGPGAIALWEDMKQAGAADTIRITMADTMWIDIVSPPKELMRTFWACTRPRQNSLTIKTSTGGTYTRSAGWHDCPRDSERNAINQIAERTNYKLCFEHNGRGSDSNHHWVVYPECNGNHADHPSQRNVDRTGWARVMFR